MQIVIDIPDNFIKDCDGNLDCVISLIGYEIDDVCSEEMGYTGFDKYTILPKGHGRLIDADALELEKEVSMADDWKTAHEIANCVKYAPTIIEADEESD